MQAKDMKAGECASFVDTGFGDGESVRTYVYRREPGDREDGNIPVRRLRSRHMRGKTVVFDSIHDETNAAFLSFIHPLLPLTAGDVLGPLNKDLP